MKITVNEDLEHWVWKESVAITSDDIEFLLVEYNGRNDGVFIDLGYGPIGAELILRPNLPLSSSGDQYIPLFIPKGSRVVTRLSYLHEDDKEKES